MDDMAWTGGQRAATAPHGGMQHMEQRVHVFLPQVLEPRESANLTEEGRDGRTSTHWAKAAKLLKGGAVRAVQAQSALVSKVQPNEVKLALSTRTWFSELAPIHRGVTKLDSIASVAGRLTATTQEGAAGRAVQASP